MFCPGCKKEHLISLSVCPACGCMVGDSVREELETKITIVKHPTLSTRRKKKEKVQKPSSPIKLNPSPSNVLTETRVKTATTEIDTKNTNRTLLEFQSKDGTVPEWRTQLRNAVRQRQVRNHCSEHHEDVVENHPTGHELPKDDDFFDSVEIIEMRDQPESENELLASALKRISRSRDKYHVTEPSASGGTATAAALAPAPESEEINDEAPLAEKASVNFPTKPKKFSPNIDLYDTSELDPEFEPAKVSSSFGRGSAVQVQTEVTVEKKAEPEVDTPAAEVVAATEEDSVDYIEDDQAPFAYRFNAGLFDLLTTSFVSLILLAPFVLLGGSWFSVAGVFAFLATWTIVNFIYLTTTVGLFGKSFGMHLFSLEMIDSGGDEYPTLHQAAVSSAVYLLSVFLLGAGFFTCFFDEENRPLHDIMSNTLVVREL